MNAWRSIRAACFGFVLAVTANADRLAPSAILLPTPKYPQANAHLGASLAMEGDYIIVGAPDAHSADLRGAVAVFSASSGTLLFELLQPASSQFGYAVAISGGRVAVGMPVGYTAGGGTTTAPVYVYDLNSATPTIPTLTLQDPTTPQLQDGNYTGFGKALAMSGSLLVVGAPYTAGVGSYYPGRVYVYDLASANPATPLAVLDNPSPPPIPAYGWFGDAVSISGTIVAAGSELGAPRKVHLYDMAGVNPSAPILTFQQGSNDSAFARKVAVSGRYVVITATEPSTRKIAYLYDRENASPATPIAVFEDPGSGSLPSSPYFLSVADNLLLLSSPSITTGAIGPGAAYLYDLQSPYQTAPVAAMTNPSANPSDDFGRVTAVAGTRAVIGAPYVDQVGTADVGLAYLYDLSISTNQVDKVLRDYFISENYHFGSSVATYGSRIAIGAPGDQETGRNPGTVYLFDTNAQAPSIPTVLINPRSDQGGSFGTSLAMSASLLVVGAGSPHIYDLTNPTATAPMLDLHDQNGADYFGNLVALSDRAIAVAVYATTSSPGRVDLYSLDSETPDIPLASLTSPVGSTTDGFGSSIAMSDSLLVVGAANDGSTYVNPGGGVAYVYDFSSPTPTIPVLSLHNPHPEERAYFGYSVAAQANRVVVSAYVPVLEYPPIGEGGSPSGNSAIYVYDLNSAYPAAPLRLENPYGAGTFGNCVAISGSRVFVGSTTDNFNAYAEGATFVYDLDSAYPFAPADVLRHNAPHQYDKFGSSIAVASERVVIGAPFDDTLSIDAGAAYIFATSNSPPSPDIAVLDGNYGYRLRNNGSSVFFGSVNYPPSSTPSQKLVLKNLGNAILTDAQVNIEGADAGDFRASYGFGSTSQLRPFWDQWQLSLEFHPSSPGLKIATLHITSNDPDDNPFDVTVYGQAYSAQEAWRNQYFGTAENSGSAADTADPDGDGCNNLFEFVAGLSPTDRLSRFNTRIEPVPGQPGQMAIKFSPIVAGRTYTVKTKSDISEPTASPLTSFTFSDSNAERTVIDLSGFGTTKYYSVEVTKQ